MTVNVLQTKKLAKNLLAWVSTKTAAPTILIVNIEKGWIDSTATASEVMLVPLKVAVGRSVICMVA